MGWTSYNVPKPVNRKTECDKASTWDEERSSCRVLKSVMKGSVWYGACEYTNKTTGESKVFGCVSLTAVDNKEYDNFAIKQMDETMCPCYNDCPSGILKLLSPTENDYALKWRKACEAHNANENFRHKKLQSLPKGTVIQFCFQNGDKVEATKCSPAYQFKKTWWSTSDGRYVKKKDIPDDFLVVSK